jgi:hypothetical protein
MSAMSNVRAAVAPDLASICEPHTMQSVSCMLLLLHAL